MGKNLPLILSFEVQPMELEEGEEPEAFFEALGGKTDYPEQAEGGPILSPKLHHFSADKSTEEIFDFKREVSLWNRLKGLCTFKRIKTKLFYV